MLIKYETAYSCDIGFFDSCTCGKELATQTELGIDELIDEIMNLPSKSFSYFPIATAAIEEANKRENKPLFLLNE